MISRKIEEFVTTLAKDKNILVLANRDVFELMDIFEKFNTVIFEAINDSSIKNLSFNFTKNKVDIVVFVSDENCKYLVSMYGNINAISPQTGVLAILPPHYPKNSDDLETVIDVVNIYDEVMGSELNRKIILNRLFKILSAQHTLNESSSDLNILEDVHQNNKKELEEFLDIYEGAVMFLIDNIKELTDSLKDGNLSATLLEEIGSEMMEVHEIFSIHKYTQKVAPIFKDFSAYLKNLDLETIAPENLEGFNYLTAILDDINAYLKDYFIDRIFSDVYMFQHSLESNIEFMKNRLAGNVEDDSELEFF